MNSYDERPLLCDPLHRHCQETLQSQSQPSLMSISLLPSACVTGNDYFVLISLAARSEALVCGRSFPGIEGSNAAGGMDICLLLVLYVVR